MESDAAVLRGRRSAQTRSRAVWCGIFFLATVILIGPAIWNGFPLLQYDTGGYLARWFEGYLVPSRPAAYGLMLAATAPLEFWPVLVLQAAAAIWILALLLREAGLGRRPHVLLGVVAGLSVATTLPWLTSILLTDIFAGLAVLALHLVVFGRTPGAWERWALILFIAFAAATHSATLALVAALTTLLFVAALVRGSQIAPAQLRQAGATLILGVALTLTANCVVAGRFAFTPGGYGILFGRMLQDGIVSRYLTDHCPDRSLKLCPYRGELPLDADAFLWGDSVFNRLGRFDGLGEEMRTIVLDSLREYPLMQVETAVAATARQLVKIATGEGVTNQVWHTYGIIKRYTPGVVSAMRAARQQRGEIAFEAINDLHVSVALIAAALLPLVIVAGLKWWHRPDLSLLAATVAIALIANAVVCGALSNPHDRYGARLIWLAPLTLVLAPISVLAAAAEPGRRRRRVFLGGLTSGDAAQEVSGA